MRLFIIALLCLPAPLLAWEFHAAPLCTLEHETEAVRVTITYDAAQPLYTMRVTLKSGSWAPSDRFGVLFAGPLGLTIGTSRHQITGADLTVSDSGFGNVLNGLQYNEMARLYTDHQQIDVSLTGAAQAVARFRDCPKVPLA